MSPLTKSLVAVGVGNTSVQIGLFDDLESTSDSGARIPIPATHLVLPAKVADWELLADDLPESISATTPWYIASVHRESASAVQQWITTHFPAAKIHQLKNDEFPIRLGVHGPTRVGTDRVAAATAVNRLRKEDQCAIFSDAGTAITVNAIDAEGRFLGGAILPGTTTAGRALDKSTDQLPEVQVRADQEQPAAIGRDTKPAIASGVYWGSIGAVREILQRISAELGCDAPKIFITGGFGPAIAEHLGAQAEYIPHLVLSGIALAARNL